MLRVGLGKLVIGVLNVLLLFFGRNGGLDVRNDICVMKISWVEGGCGSFVEIMIGSFFIDGEV